MKKFNDMRLKEYTPSKSDYIYVFLLLALIALSGLGQMPY